MLPGCIQLDSESELMTPEIVLMQFRASQQFLFKHNNLNKKLNFLVYEFKFLKKDLKVLFIS